MTSSGCRPGQRVCTSEHGLQDYASGEVLAVLEQGEQLVEQLVASGAVLDRLDQMASRES